MLAHQVQHLELRQLPQGRELLDGVVGQGDEAHFGEVHRLDPPKILHAGPVQLRDHQRPREHGEFDEVVFVGDQAEQAVQAPDLVQSVLGPSRRGRMHTDTRTPGQGRRPVLTSREEIQLELMSISMSAESSAIDVEPFRGPSIPIPAT